MVLEEVDTRRVVDGLIAYELFIKDRGHRRHVFVAEPYVRAHESRVARAYGFDSHLVFRKVRYKVAGEYLFGQRHRAARGSDFRERYFALKPRDVEREEAAVLDDLPRDLVLAACELFQIYLLAPHDALDQIKIRRGEQPEVLAILFVDALYVFGDYKPDSGGDLGIRRLLAAGPF